MNPQDSQRDCAGWFGKIPSLGDFAMRRLPASFLGPWDEWLSSELSAAQLELADDWDSVYRHAPVCCFSLGTGTAGEHAWHGILVPSFDRVGRQFPLTIALRRPTHADAPGGRAWWAQLVEAGRRALAPTCDADGVDEALSDFMNRSVRVERALASISAGTSAWWIWSDEDPAEAVMDIFVGLPRGPSFRKVLGSWLVD